MWYTCGDGRECFMEEGSSTNVAYIIIHESGSLLDLQVNGVRRGHGLCKQTKNRIKKKIGRNSIVCDPEYNIDCFVIEKILMYLFPLHYYLFARQEGKGGVMFLALREGRNPTSAALAFKFAKNTDLYCLQ